jgi:hypothetical protein
MLNGHFRFSNEDLIHLDNFDIMLRFDELLPALTRHGWFEVVENLAVDVHALHNNFWRQSTQNEDWKLKQRKETLHVFKSMKAIKVVVEGIAVDSDNDSKAECDFLGVFRMTNDKQKKI